MDSIVNHFERTIVYFLLFLMMLLIAVSSVELAVILVQQLIAPPFLLLNIKEMQEVLGFFLMVLIGLELLETVKAYLYHHQYKIDVILLVALIAISRKIIILEYSGVDAMLLLGMAAMIIALSAGWYLVAKGSKFERETPQE